MHHIDELTKARRTYTEQSAKTIELDMRVIANRAEGQRLDVEIERSKELAAEARATILKLEEAPIMAKPGDVKSAFALQVVAQNGTDPAAA